MAGFRINSYDGNDFTSAGINMASATTVTIVAASAGTRVRLYKGMLVAAAANGLAFSDGTTNFTASMTLSTGTPLVIPNDGNPWIITGTGNGLNIISSSAVQTSGILWFTQSPYHLTGTE